MRPVWLLVLSLAALGCGSGENREPSARTFEITEARVVGDSAEYRYVDEKLITKISGSEGSVGIPEVLRLGDRITVNARSLTINYLSATECLKQMKYGGEVFCDKGQVTCVAYESPGDNPSDESYSGSKEWIYVKHCAPKT